MIRNGRGTSQALGPMGAAVAASVSAAAPLAKKLTFEVLNLVTQSLPLPPAARGAAVGAVLCAITLPITKCFRSTMNLPLPGNIYKAYGSNFLKDVIYGALRAKISALLLKHLKLNPAKRNHGRCYCGHVCHCCGSLRLIGGSQSTGGFFKASGARDRCPSPTRGCAHAAVD